MAAVVFRSTEATCAAAAGRFVVFVWILSDHVGVSSFGEGRKPLEHVGDW